MKTFSSKMSKDIKEMLELKAATNYKESTYLSRSKAFDRFCAEHFPEETVITEAVALSWIKDALDNHARNTAHSRMAYLRVLGRQQKATGKDPYIPPLNMLHGRSLFIPYIFTDEELTGLFHAVDTCKTVSRFDRFLFSTYFRLTYTCGLRPVEGRHLRRPDVDLNTGEIRIINSKWNRSRTIVMSDDMCALARQFALRRDLKYPESEYFFPTHNGECYSSGQMQNQFKKFYAASRPDIPTELLPAVRVYDLRHRFATAVLAKWLDQGEDIHARLPYLQTYMGHKNVSSTVYYIHILPENLKKSSGIDWKNLDAIIPEVEPWEEE